MDEGPPPASGRPERVESFPIVGIGASAGGLESLERLFANLPEKPGMAFVVVQHLSPDFRSMMSELLGRYSRMPVVVAEHGMEVEPDRVYLLPPRKEITIAERRLHLADKSPTQAVTLPIDLFFRSLASDVAENAVAIVLSGSGSDGSRGIRDVKRAGGRVLAESPEAAKFDGMPLSALATGLVDFSGSPPELARFLTGQPTSAASGDGATAEAEEPPLEAILRLLRSSFGLDFSLYKRSTVTRRIQRRVALREAADIEDYVQELRSNPTELGALYHDLLIGVTRFFRDPEAFAILEQQVIPELVERIPAGEEIRVWVAGCATGEEAYSIAMLLFEELSARDRPVLFKVLATDVHRSSLEHGSLGLYGEEQLADVRPQRRERFFTRKAGGFQVSQDLRQRLVFVPHDLTHDAPLTKMHLVACRNLLIYFEPDVQKTVLSLFHFGLVAGGVLFLGSSETTGPLAHEFDVIDDHWKIYRKRRGVRLLAPLRLPIARKPIPPVAPLAPSAGTASPLLPIYDRLLDRYMPPSVLVDEERNVVETFGGAERHLRWARRRPSTNVLELLRGDLRTVVAGAIQRVLGTDGTVRHVGVTVGDEEGVRRVTLTAEGILTPRTGARHVLLTFEEETPIATDGKLVVSGAAREGGGDGADPEERLNVLQTELAYTRETLQSAIEEQQTSNEELQAANEELVASNEELQSTNEELHSVNEELYTVNAEYQKKILELRELNDDMQHLLDGTDVGTLFLDRQLRIRKFTPRVASVFHVRAGDVGRNLRDFTHDLVRPALFDELERVMREGVAVEDEVQDRHDTTFFMRILPYRPAIDRGASEDVSVSPADDVEGVMLSLTDISALDHARGRIRQLSSIVESTDDAIIGKDLDGVITTWNRGAERLYGYTAEEAVGRNVKMLAPPGYESEIDEFLRVLRRGERREHVETMRVRKDGTKIDVSVALSPILDRHGVIVGASAIARDVTQLKHAQRELEQRERRIRLLLDSTAEAILGFGPDGVCTFCNPSCVRMLGYRSADELIGKRIHDLLHHDHGDDDARRGAEAEASCPIASVLRTGVGTHADDELFFRADGSSFPAEYWSYPIADGGDVGGAVVTFLDVTARKAADREVRQAARRREQFLAMLSHELRNPLAAVLNATKVMRIGAADAAAVARAREVIERQSGHMVRLLDDLLDVARITKGGIQLRKEDLDLREIVRLAVEAVSAQIAERRTRLEIELPDEPLPVRGDRTRLQQVVGNLLANAATYSAVGGRVAVSARADRERVVLIVADEGCGIAAEFLPQIFELFVQTDQGLDRARGGLGIGLALVRQLVELHGGTVAAASDGVGLGSEFRVELPLQKHALLSAPLVGRNGGGRRVVLVEDQHDAREMLKALLGAKGHVVFEASDGREAVDTIARVHPDVAFVDVGLPGLDGYEVAREVRRSGILDDVILVALTGYGAREDVEAARAAGFDEHLTKPADADRIDEILGLRRS